MKEAGWRAGLRPGWKEDGGAAIRHLAAVAPAPPRGHQSKFIIFETSLFLCPLAAQAKIYASFGRRNGLKSFGPLIETWTKNGCCSELTPLLPPFMLSTGLYGCTIWSWWQRSRLFSPAEVDCLFHVIYIGICLVNHIWPCNDMVLAMIRNISIFWEMAKYILCFQKSIQAARTEKKNEGGRLNPESWPRFLSVHSQQQPSCTQCSSSLKWNNELSSINFLKPFLEIQTHTRSHCHTTHMRKVSSSSPNPKCPQKQLIYHEKSPPTIHFGHNTFLLCMQMIIASFIFLQINLTYRWQQPLKWTCPQSAS